MRDASKLKLIVTGSAIARIELLQAEKSPLHGRVLPRTLWPLTFAEAGQGTFQVDDTTRATRYETARLTAQRYVLVLIPFQSLVHVLNAVVGPHLIQHIEVGID
jgi:hypothetical protein